MIPMRDAMKLELLALRIIAFVIALGIGYAGFAILTRPLAVPLTIALWIAAAAIVLLAMVVDVPDDANDMTR